MSFHFYACELNRPLVTTSRSLWSLKSA